MPARKARGSAEQRIYTKKRFRPVLKAARGTTKAARQLALHIERLERQIQNVAFFGPGGRPRRKAGRKK